MNLIFLALVGLLGVLPGSVSATKVLMATDMVTDAPTTPAPTTRRMTPPPPPPSPPPPPTSIFPSIQPTFPPSPTSTMIMTTHRRYSTEANTPPVKGSTLEPTEPPITPPHEPQQELMDSGGVVVLLDTSVDQFIETQEEFRSAVANIVNDYCSQTSCWNYDEAMPVRSQDVIIYSISDSEPSSARVVKLAESVYVSFYVKSPISSSSIAISSDQLEDALITNEEELEEALGYGVAVDGSPEVETKDYLLEPWITSLIVVVVVCVLVGMFVAYVAQKEKKRDPNKSSYSGDTESATGSMNDYGDSEVKTDFSANANREEIVKETGLPEEVKLEDVSDAESIEKKPLGDSDERKSDPESSTSVTVKADIESGSASGSQSDEVKSEGEAPPTYENVHETDLKESGHDNPALEVDDSIDDKKEPLSAEDGDDEMDDDGEDGGEADVTTSL